MFDSKFVLWISDGLYLTGRLKVSDILFIYWMIISIFIATLNPQLK
ncbi:hypothetical protein NEIFLAOT_00771 [Neisseria flavescens NRL30031/H210]|uniref:Uncharacterized protein n=1 Tax=Neisseria flavescens NRL30031/H210 TaxID=546264 RepID=C0ELG6_NEIFL|nr:hypothetical protein NEIFLAOT_00771 [Neisseria flavescens NRL30031/H210]